MSGRSPLLALRQVKSAQDKPADPILTLDRIFAARDFAAERFGPARWMADGESYTTLEPSADAKAGRDLVLYWAESGKREVLVSAARLVPPRRRRAARDRGLRLVARRKRPDHLHELQARLAPEYPGRFLDLRPPLRPPPEAGRGTSSRPP